MALARQHPSIRRIAVIRPIGALFAADLVAAALFVVWLIFEALIEGEPLGKDAARLSFIMVGVTAVAGLPVLAIGALPLWLAFRQRRVTRILWFVLAGSFLPAGHFGILVAAELGGGSDGGITFAENICRPLQLLRLAAVTCSGAAAGLPFHQIVRPRHE